MRLHFPGTDIDYPAAVQRVTEAASMVCLILSDLVSCA